MTVKKPTTRNIATNKRARFDYEILESVEAGLSLMGSEVKSLRAGKASIADSYAHVRDGEAWLVGAYIAPYSFSRGGGHDPERTRKLLLHRGEIDRLAGKLAEMGLTLIPMRVYFDRGKAKIELGLARGKRTYDKRRSIREREEKRDMERALSNVRRRG